MVSCQGRIKDPAHRGRAHHYPDDIEAIDQEITGGRGRGDRSARTTSPNNPVAIIDLR